MTSLINFGRTRTNGSIQVEVRLYSTDSCEFVRHYLESLFVDERLRPGDLDNPAALATRCASWANMEIRMEPRKDVDCVYWIVCDGGRPKIYQIVNFKDRQG